VRATILAAGGLACAGAAMTIAAFAGGGQAEPAAPPNPDRGAEVFAQQGCGGCHTFKPANATGGFGPDLSLALTGMARDDVMRAIVLPDADVSAGYDPGIMPQDFARRIAPQDLEALVTYLMTPEARGPS
jgi:cytochrome c oxidase subunit II